MYVCTGKSLLSLWPVLRDRDGRGQTVGQARLALALTIKSVWDFPEMLQRIVATEQERTCARRELQMTGRVCAAILKANERTRKSA